MSFIRSGGTATVTPRSADLEIPELRNTPSPVEVVLTRSAREVMLGDLFWSTRQDARESGGFLFAAPTRSWKKTVEILHATPTGDGALRRSGELALDNEMWRNAEQAFAIDGLDQPLVGFWHSHPETRDRTPSEADLAAFLAVLDFQAKRRGAGYSVNLIYAASEHYGDSWAQPHLHAWVVRYEGSGDWAQPVCEPAEIRER